VNLCLRHPRDTANERIVKLGMSTTSKIASSARLATSIVTGAMMALTGIMSAAPALATPSPLHPTYVANRSLIDDEWYLGELRERFVVAEAALRRGERVRLARLMEGLEDYPLYPYLEYADLRSRLHRARSGEIRAFLVEHADTPLGRRLRHAWLERLAQRGQWERFLDVYRHSPSVTMRCQWLRALLATGEEAEALSHVEELWLVGHSQPPECDPAFAAWMKAGLMSRDLLWRRIELAFRAGRPGLAGYLAGFLEAHERGLVDEWRRIRVDPGRVTSAARLAGDAAIVERMLIYAMQRLAHRDTARAVATWEVLRERFAFTDSGIAEVHRAIGLTYAYRHDRDALYWLDAIPREHADESTKEWRVVTALRYGEWDRVLGELWDADGPDRDSERWRYWSARSLEALGWHEDAETLYSELANERSYYGFLAADRLLIPYRLGHRPLEYDRRELRMLAYRPGAMRARELYRLGRRIDARREWRELTRGMSNEELAKAAKLAHDMGWHGRAILTVARTPYRDDLELRFPLAYRDRVLRHARARAIDPAWMYAILRQESAFIPDARSPAGALGLMQIMPGTGKRIARRLRVSLEGRHQLLEEDTSLRFGSSYLRTLLDRLDEHPILATAAYNAGPHRVERWRPDEGALPADVWIESIPFSETREYLRRVLAYTTIYEQRLGGDRVRLSQRLVPVAARAGELVRAVVEDVER